MKDMTNTKKLIELPLNLPSPVQTVPTSNGLVPTPGFLPALAAAAPSPAVTPPFPAAAAPHLPLTPAPTPPAAHTHTLPLQPLTNISNLPLQSLSPNTIAPVRASPNSMLSHKLDGKKDCLHMQNLPLDASMGNVLAFLDDLSRKATSVHIMYDMHGMPRGEAIVQMDSGESAKLAELQTSGKQIIFNNKSYVLDATQISKEEISKTFAQAQSPAATSLVTPQQQVAPQQALLAAPLQQNLQMAGGQLMYHHLMQQVRCVLLYKAKPI